MKTKHDLIFEVAPWEPLTEAFPVGTKFSNEGFQRFRVGTVEGLWRCTPTAYEILAVSNSSPGNGHLNDLFQFFEHSCVRDNKDLRVLEVWNKKFKKHLLRKKGFSKDSKDNVIKKLKK